MLRLCARTPRYFTRHGALFVRNVHLQLPYPVEGGLGDFLPPSALEVVAVDYQGGLVQRLNDETFRTEYQGKSIVDTVLHAARAASLVEADAYVPAVWPRDAVEDEDGAEDVDVREPDHVSLFKWSTLILNNHFFLTNLKPLEGDARNHQEKLDHVLLSRIKEDYGSLGQLKSTLSAASLGVFSGGHVWLVSTRDGHLAVVPTFGRGSALIRGRRYMGPPMNDPSDPLPRPLSREKWQRLEEDHAADVQKFRSLLAEKPLPEDVASQFPDIDELFDEAPRLLAQRDAWVHADPEWRLRMEDIDEQMKKDAVVSDDEFDNTSVETRDQPVTADSEPVDVYELEKFRKNPVEPNWENLRFMDPLKLERLYRVSSLLQAVDDTLSGTQDSAPPADPPPSSDPKPLGAPREFHTSAAIRAIEGPKSVLGKFLQKPQTPYDATLNADVSPSADNKNKEDQYEIVDDDHAAVWPLFCVPVHEHLWLTAGYGVWGQEKWMQKFWSVLDWEKVSARYLAVMTEPDPAVFVDEFEDDEVEVVDEVKKGEEVKEGDEVKKVEEDDEVKKGDEVKKADEVTKGEVDRERLATLMSDPTFEALEMMAETVGPMDKIVEFDEELELEEVAEKMLKDLPMEQQADINRFKKDLKDQFKKEFEDLE
ncbi:hypothetical protein BDZ89DRAFT_1015918 [Hymenopellis radicata]|nr:hypothetical protein BDZ89DRAFT_1015918 [Hymenopellis radicata]